MKWYDVFKGNSTKGLGNMLSAPVYTLHTSIMFYTQSIDEVEPYSPLL